MSAEFAQRVVSFNISFQIEDEWFGRSVIRSCVKLSYDHAQGFIDQPERDWTQEELPTISEKYTVDDIKTRVLNLHKVLIGYIWVSLIRK